MAGLGPIGLLATLVLVLRGAAVYGLDIVDPSTVRPRWLEAIGGRYVDGRTVAPVHVDDALGQMDLIVEAAGVSTLAFNLLDALAFDGAYALTGIPSGDKMIQLPGAELMRQLVLNNQVMLGSVNAARDHFQIAVDDLSLASARWGTHVAKLITNCHPARDFDAALYRHTKNEIKVVLE